MLTPQRLFRFLSVHEVAGDDTQVFGSVLRYGDLHSVLFTFAPAHSVVEEVVVGDTLVWEGEHPATQEVFFAPVKVVPGTSVRVLVSGPTPGRLHGVANGHPSGRSPVRTDADRDAPSSSWCATYNAALHAYLMRRDIGGNEVEALENIHVLCVAIADSAHGKED